MITKAFDSCLLNLLQGLDLFGFLCFLVSILDSIQHTEDVLPPPQWSFTNDGGTELP